MVKHSSQTFYNLPLVAPFSLQESTRQLLRYCLILAISVAFFLIIAYRIDKAPDIHLDEVLYYHVAFNLATEGQFSWDMRPVLVHPPVYFLTQALFLHLVGLTHQFLPFDGTYTVRLVNAFAGAITIAFLFRLIERLGGLRAALLASAIFMLDPFVVRINRRNMLETMAEMWVVIGLYLFWRQRERLTTRNMLLIGTIFGLALLTKELMIFGLAVIPLFTLLTGRWRDFKKAIAICGVALSIWCLYPFWAWSIGQGEKFFHNKTFNLRRLIGLVQVTGWNRPDVSFLDALQVHFVQYGTSYTLILVGALLTTLLFFTWRNERGRFVLAWSGMMYAFSVYIIVAGTLNEFFFYYLMLPAIATVSLMTIRYWDLWRGKAQTALSGLSDQPAGVLMLTMSNGWPKWISVGSQVLDRYLLRMSNSVQQLGQRLMHKRLMANSLLLFIILFGLVIQSYNSYRWVKLFGVGEDRALYELVQYVEQNLSPNIPLNSMFGQGDLMLSFMLPHHDFVSLREPKQINDSNVVYTMLSSKNLWGAYGAITPEYYEWVDKHGEVLFNTYGNTFWDVGLYRLPLGQDEYRKALEPIEAVEDELLELLGREEY